MSDPHDTSEPDIERIRSMMQRLNERFDQSGGDADAAGGEGGWAADGPPPPEIARAAPPPAPPRLAPPRTTQPPPAPPRPESLLALLATVDAFDSLEARAASQGAPPSAGDAGDEAAPGSYFAALSAALSYGEPASASPESAAPGAHFSSPPLDPPLRAARLLGEPGFSPGRAAAPPGGGGRGRPSEPETQTARSLPPPSPRQAPDISLAEETEAVLGPLLVRLVGDGLEHIVDRETRLHAAREDAEPMQMYVGPLRGHARASPHGPRATQDGQDGQDGHEGRGTPEPLGHLLLRWATGRA